MGSEWPILKLGDVVSITSSKRIFASDYQPSGVPFYRSKEVIEKHKGNSVSTELYISEEKFDSIKTKFGAPEPGDILLTSVGTIGVPYLVQEGEKFYFKDGNLTWLQTSSSDVNSKYVYLWLTSENAKQAIYEVTIGSTQQALTIVALKSLEVPLPPLPEQKAIAHILGSLDDKIEANRRMNATLEAMAQALFKSWFVDFDPVIDNALSAGNPIPEELHPRAETRRQALANGTANRDIAKLFPDSFQESESMGWIPSDWRIGSMLEEAKLLSGGTPKTSEPDYWDGSIKWASAKDVSQCGKAFLIETERSITQLGLDKSSTKIIPKLSTVVVARGATTGRMTMFGEDIAMNQTCYGLRMMNECHFFGYSHAKHFISSLVNAAHGSVFDTITTKTFEASKTTLPDIEPIKLFEKTAEPIFTKVLENQKQTATLTKLRDTLLPKLISGELRIPQAQKLA